MITNNHKTNYKKNIKPTAYELIMGRIIGYLGGIAIVLIAHDMHIIIILILGQKYAYIITHYVLTYTT